MAVHFACRCPQTSKYGSAFKTSVNAFSGFVLTCDYYNQNDYTQKYKTLHIWFHIGRLWKEEKELVDLNLI